MTQEEKTLNIPKDKIDSDWTDDVDYEPYENERDYIPPAEVSKESISKIKAIKLRLGKIALSEQH